MYAEIRGDRSLLRLVILMSLLVLALDFSSYQQEEEELVYAPEAKTQKSPTYYAERNSKRWEKLVNLYANKMLIKDYEFAEKVVTALEEAAAEFDMDPWLMASLIRIESAGNPNAISRVGAIGLTQIMPETGKHIAEELGMEEFSTDDLYNPAINIRMGTFYLRSLLDRFDGNRQIALAAYNWGPGHIEERIAKGAALPRQYPGKVLGKYKN